MTTKFNKPNFEDKIYELVLCEINDTLPELVKTGGDVLMYQRQLLNAIHFVIEESVVQILYSVRLMAQLQAKEDKQ